MDLSPRSNVYLKANLLHEFLGDWSMTMDNGTDAPLLRTGDYSESWFVYGLGASLRFGNAADARRANIFYLDVEQEWFYNAGFRFMM